jgi:hypothetical protein
LNWILNLNARQQMTLTLCRWLLRRSAEKSVCCHWRLGRRRVSSSPFLRLIDWKKNALVESYYTII